MENISDNSYLENFDGYYNTVIDDVDINYPEPILEENNSNISPQHISNFNGNFFPQSYDEIEKWYAICPLEIKNMYDKKYGKGIFSDDFVSIRNTACAMDCDDLPRPEVTRQYLEEKIKNFLKSPELIQDPDTKIMKDWYELYIWYRHYKGTEVEKAYNEKYGEKSYYEDYQISDLLNGDPEYFIEQNCIGDTTEPEFYIKKIEALKKEIETNIKTSNELFEPKIAWLKKFIFTFDSQKYYTSLTINLDEFHAKAKSYIEKNSYSLFNNNPCYVYISFIQNFSFKKLTKQTDIDLSKLILSKKDNFCDGKEEKMKNNLEELTKHAKKANLLDIGYFVANKKKFKTKLGTPKMLEPVNFLHSEQLFFTNYLFEDDAYKKIAHKLNNKNNQDKVEIQAIILSMYTRRYICENCQPTLLAFQFSNLFINNFLKAIEQEKLPISIKKNVLFFSTVSASVPFNYQNPKPEDKVPEHAHEAKIYKLNELHNGCLFLQNADLQAKKEDKVLFSGNKFTYKK